MLCPITQWLFSFRNLSFILCRINLPPHVHSLAHGRARQSKLQGSINDTQRLDHVVLDMKLVISTEILT